MKSSAGGSRNCWPGTFDPPAVTPPGSNFFLGDGIRGSLAATARRYFHPEGLWLTAPSESKPLPSVNVFIPKG